MASPSQLNEMNFDSWCQFFARDWHQGEHVALIGQTGTGKTTVAKRILESRDHVCVLAIKRVDESIEQFRTASPHYDIITTWPPLYTQNHVILWIKPRSLDRQDVQKQAIEVHHAMSDIYIAGGWCLYLDEAGYIAGVLGLSGALGIMLNQGRSAHISVVCTMTRPSSLVARIPRESLTQVRHHLIFKFTDESELRKCAEIVGISFQRMLSLQRELRYNPEKGYSDFVYVGKGNTLVVRNVPQKER